MTEKLKEEITHLLKLTTGRTETVNGLPIERLTESIAQMVDEEFSKVLMKETSMGQMLEAVGLEIRSKE
jgi:hypothetical protein